MRSHRAAVLAAMVFSLAFVRTCTSPISDDAGKKKGNAGQIVIGGKLKNGLGKYSTAEPAADSLIAVNVFHGRIQEEFDKAPGAVVASDGTFRIELPKTCSFMLNNVLVDSPATWLLLLVNTQAQARFDRIVGFLALKEVDQSLISFPMTKVKKDSIGMGTVSREGDEAVGDTTIPSDTAVFNMTLAQLQQMAHTGKTLKMIKNAYGLHDPVTKKGIRLRTTYVLYDAGLSEAMNRELKPSQYFDTSKFIYTVQVFPGLAPGFNYEEIINKTATFDLFPPAGSTTLIQNNNNGYVSAVPISCYSTDTSKNPWIATDGSGGKVRVNTYVDGNASGVTSIFYHNFKGISPGGVWKLKKNQSELIAQFDLGLGTPVDTNSGKPRIYVPSMNVMVNTGDTTLTSVSVAWYYWDQASATYLQATDLSLIQSNISEANIRVSNLTTSEGVNFGTQENGTPHEQPVPVQAVFTPTKTFKYYAEKGGKFSINVDYTCFMQTFSVSVTGFAK